MREFLEGLDTRLLVDLRRDRSKPDRSLGQHFLIDEESIQRSIVLASEHGIPLSTDSHVLEIGPGAGSLTLALLRTGSMVSALEIDQESVSHLARVFGNRGTKLEVKSQDALSGGWPKAVSHVVSNLPYQISSPILEKIRQYHEKSPLKLCVLLVQEEFGYRMAMKSLPYDSGPLGLNLWLDFDVFLDNRVPPNCFSPSPRVNSRLVVLKPVTRMCTEGLNKQLFRVITKHCFANRRRKMKTLLSNPPTRISRVTGWHKKRWHASVSNLLHSELGELKNGWEDLRPENLTPENWISITQKLVSA